MKPDFDFIIEHRESDGVHYLKFIAKHQKDTEKEIEVTPSNGMSFGLIL